MAEVQPLQAGDMHLHLKVKVVVVVHSRSGWRKPAGHRAAGVGRAGWVQPSLPLGGAASVGWGHEHKFIITKSVQL